MGSSYSPRRRTAAVLAGEGTSAAYLAGAMKSFSDAGLRIDLVVGKGAGALVAAFSSIQAESRLYGEQAFLRDAGRGSFFRWRPSYLIALCALAVSFGAFLSPALIAVGALFILPIATLVGQIAPQWTASWGPEVQAWVLALVSRAEPFYLRFIALPMVFLFVMLVARGLWALLGARRSGLSSLTWIPGAPFDLTPLTSKLETALWQAVRGTATEQRPAEASALGEAYCQLLSASLGQNGFKELLFYALDTDGGREVPFALLKERFLKKVRTHRDGSVSSEVLDLSGEEGAKLLFGGLVASVSPPVLTPNVPMRLPLGSEYGGEVHRFSSSIFTGASAIADAVAAGAEQVIYVSGSPREPSAGPASWERLADAAARQDLERDLMWAAEHLSVPVFVVRPDKARLGTFQLEGRVMLGGEKLELSALIAEGERDAERQLLQPILGDDHAPALGEATVPVAADKGTQSSQGSAVYEAGPREF